jgi:hypothetical protein
LRLAGGDNAIGMIWGDLVGSEQFRGARTCQPMAGGRWSSYGPVGPSGPDGRRCDNRKGKRQPMPSEESDGS